MRPIAIFYHCMTVAPIVKEQMERLRSSGLAAAAQYFLAGVNASRGTAWRVSRLLPQSACVVLHGDRSRSENPTIVEIEKWVPGHAGWYVLYVHTKGASRPSDRVAKSWRDCMMQNLVANWRQCVQDLEGGCDAVGCHWVRGLDDTQHYFAGNFWWATSDFLQKVPAIGRRAAIIRHGLGSLKSRYEAEVWLGNGPQPRVKDYHAGMHW